MQPDTTNYRDHLSAVSKTGKRIRLYPWLIKGNFYNRRRIVAIVLLCVLTLIPFIKTNNTPLLMFNFPARVFSIFTIPFFPQDTFVFGLITIVFLISIIIFTAAFGRIFCGWVCPQTIFLEFIFRPIEKLFEGSAEQRKKRDEGSFTLNKLLRKAGKHLCFFAISFCIANLFLSYIIGVDEVYKIITEPINEHWVGLVQISAFSIVFYFVFAHVRELVCIWACPYGRLQGVLIGKETIVVAYDHLRGEPRGKLKKNTTGDCVDCGLCVKVCPTGIDIRNGTQLECINCTACIDACNSVMNKIHKPENLIGYKSASSIENNKQLKFDKRLSIYSMLLCMLFIVIASVLWFRPNAELTVLRTPGQLYTTPKQGWVSNLYNYELINKTFHPKNFDLEIENMPEAQIKFIGNENLYIDKEGMIKGTLFIEIPKKYLPAEKTRLNIIVKEHQRKICVAKTTFFSPLTNP